MSWLLSLASKLYLLCFCFLYLFGPKCRFFWCILNNLWVSCSNFFKDSIFSWFDSKFGNSVELLKFSRFLLLSWVIDSCPSLLCTKLGKLNQLPKTGYFTDWLCSRRAILFSGFIFRTLWRGDTCWLLYSLTPKVLGFEFFRLTMIINWEWIYVYVDSAASSLFFWS